MASERFELALLTRLFHWSRRMSWASLGPKVRGRGLEFGAYRPYSPGDDIRALDWIVYARLERLVIKQTEAEAELKAELIIDVSASMACGEPPVFPFATLAAAALGAVAAGRGAELRVRSERAPEARESFRGEARLGALLKALRRHEPAGEGALRQALGALPGLQRRDLFIFTDALLASEPLIKALRRLRHAGHQVTVVVIEPPAEFPESWLKEDAGGRLWQLTDAETGEESARFVDRELAEAMNKRRRGRVAEFCRALERERLASLVLNPASELEQAIHGLFRPLDGGGIVAGGSAIC